MGWTLLCPGAGYVEFPREFSSGVMFCKEATDLFVSDPGMITHVEIVSFSWDSRGIAVSRKPPTIWC